MKMEDLIWPIYLFAWLLLFSKALRGEILCSIYVFRFSSIASSRTMKNKISLNELRWIWRRKKDEGENQGILCKRNVPLRNPFRCFYYSGIPKRGMETRYLDPIVSNFGTPTPQDSIKIVDFSSFSWKMTPS